jgi:heme/copper-type cytochrome/quinol oxidase subunit 2
MQIVRNQSKWLGPLVQDDDDDECDDIFVVMTLIIMIVIYYEHMTLVCIVNYASSNRVGFPEIRTELLSIETCSFWFMTWQV